MLHLFERATCFVMPSHVEAFGIAYLEAAAAGLSVIGTTVGGASDAVGPAGVCVDPADHVAIATAMRRMVDPGVAMRYGSAGPAHASKYTWEKVARRLVRAMGLLPLNSRSSE